MNFEEIDDKALHLSGGFRIDIDSGGRPSPTPSAVLAGQALTNKVRLCEQIESLEITLREALD